MVLYSSAFPMDLGGEDASAVAWELVAPERSLKYRVIDSERKLIFTLEQAAEVAWVEQKL